ncbi:hypothetical protein R1flu_003628 [Riccia fluitans]|uniref:Uncharacterized protein n=1 Tax=Riccia fluitans TaxID=41844 RepID=A0ABD1Y9K0_9MARC
MTTFRSTTNTPSWQNLPRVLQGKSGTQRLEVLEAHGRTVNKFDTSYAEECNLTLSEWAALLLGLSSNPGLEELRLCSSTTWRPAIVEKDAEEWQELGMSLAQIVRNASTLKKVVLQVGYGSQARLLEQLGLNNPYPHLEELNLVCDLAEPDSESGLNHAANMIADVTSLRKLVLRLFSESQPLGRPTIQALSNALKENASLQSLEVASFCEEGASGVGEVLLDAFTGDSACQNLERLVWTMTSSAATIEFGRTLPVLMWKAYIRDLVITINCDTFLDVLKRKPLWCFEHRPQLFQDFPWGSVGFALRSARDVKALRFKRLTIWLDWDWCFSEGTRGARSDCLDDLMEGMSIMWDASQQSRLLHFSLNWCFTVLTCHDLDFCKKPLGVVGLREVHFVLGHTSLSDPDYEDSICSVLDTFNMNTSVEMCSFGFRGTLLHENTDLVRKLQKIILTNLLHNTSVTTLTLTSTFFPVVTDDVIREVVRLQTGNSNLRSINIGHGEARQRVSAEVGHLSKLRRCDSKGSKSSAKPSVRILRQTSSSSQRTSVVSEQAGIKRKNALEIGYKKRRPWGSGGAIEGACRVWSLRASSRMSFDG